MLVCSSLNQLFFFLLVRVAFDSQPTQVASRGTRGLRLTALPFALRRRVLFAFRFAAAIAVLRSWCSWQRAWTFPSSRNAPPSAISTMWSTSVLGAVQPGHWQEGWAWRVRVRREAQGARWEGWAWSHRVCAEGARFAWVGHRDDPEGVRREHPGWVHLVGGMVGVMAPAYTPRPERATVTWVTRPPTHELVAERGGCARQRLFPRITSPHSLL